VLTVAFATRDRAATLARVLAAFARLAPPEGGGTLVVVDNGSTDGTAALLRSQAGRVGRLPLTVLTEPRPGKNRALNAALPHLQGDLAVWTDDDVIPAPDWLPRLREAADARPEATMLGGTVELDWPGPAPPWLTPEAVDLSVLYARNLRPSGPCDHTAIFGPCMAVRRRVFEEGFRFAEAVGPDASRPLYPMGGETELLRRLDAAGHRGWFAAEARVRHIVRPEQIEEAWILERAYRYGLGEGRNHLGRGRAGAGGLLLRALALRAAAVALRPMRPFPGRLRVLFRERCQAGALAGLRAAEAARIAAAGRRGAADAPIAAPAPPRHHHPSAETS
jgi:glycosyltransferase involved in cell wall biosynthesis